MSNSDELTALLTYLRTELEQCKEDIYFWGSYAESYAQYKHGWREDIRRVCRAIDRVDGVLNKSVNNNQ